MRAPGHPQGCFHTEMLMDELADKLRMDPVAFRIKEKDLVAIFGARALHIVEPATGKKLSSYPWRTEFDGNAADPAFYDEQLFITSGWERGCALLDVSGTSPSCIGRSSRVALRPSAFSRTSMRRVS